MIDLKIVNVKKIGIFRALQLGDLLCSVPAIKAIRHAYPNAEITLIGMLWAKGFVERFSHYIDRFIAFPGYPGFPEQEINPPAIVSFLSDMQREKFDLVLQMQGNGTIANSLIMLFGARSVAGFHQHGNYRPNSSLFVEYSMELHEIERHLKLVKHLNIPYKGKELEFPLTKKDWNDYEDLHLPLEPHYYVCVHPGSRGMSRRWPAAYFATLADLCASYGLQVIITGVKEELEVAEEVMTHMKYQAINTTGRTTMGSVGCLLKNAALLISNCTGVSHVASALGTPGIIISLDGESQRWASLNKSLHKSFDWTRKTDFDEVCIYTDGLLKKITQADILANKA
ncbi:MAG: glycosyltransferase family 9 protein [Chitinophagaceae bacterium]|nr:glycosyltransferase family 9 protein [Chitinophagaceae bacterium]